ncbi:MAG: hypothetical protein QF441_08770 [Bacteriovoracaceae bacterium]|jgi:hypothetical protein|nr:hypothetical protein [Bacteriovoracaceae bacterium]|tara:strand:+ start:196 stop:402 length:207 start_codon:yes stop_codon:yes gene_type:complete
MTALEHEFLVDDYPLDIGDEVFRYMSEPIPLRSYDSKNDDPDRKVYNLLLDGNNTYYANDYLVHNKPG